MSQLVEHHQLRRLYIAVCVDADGRERFIVTTLDRSDYPTPMIAIASGDDEAVIGQILEDLTTLDNSGGSEGPSTVKIYRYDFHSIAVNDAPTGDKDPENFKYPESDEVLKENDPHFLQMLEALQEESGAKVTEAPQSPHEHLITEEGRAELENLIRSSTPIDDEVIAYVRGFLDAKFCTSKNIADFYEVIRFVLSKSAEGAGPHITNKAERVESLVQALAALLIFHAKMEQEDAQIGMVYSLINHAHQILRTMSGTA
jgi:hypothetical protein